MAGIDLALTGLMLICLDGQPNCPRLDRNTANTAWSLPAKNTDTDVCGWSNSLITTTLEVKIRKSDFTVNTGTCVDEIKLGLPTGFLLCRLPQTGNICVTTNVAPDKANTFPREDESLGTLPRLEEIDPRFKRLDKTKLQAFSTATVSFPPGELTAGAVWKYLGNTVTWYRSDRSDGGTLPSPLSDRLRVHYGGAKKILMGRNCGGNALLEVTSLFPGRDVEVIVRNSGIANSSVDDERGFHLVPYVLYYYRLGNWGSGLRDCPKYHASDQAPAVVLACRAVQSEPCYCSEPGCDADTTYWPPFLHPDH